MKVIEHTWWRLLQSFHFERTWWRLLQSFHFEHTWWRLLSIPDEDYWAYLMRVIEHTWWKLLSIPDEGYWAYLMKVIEHTWWRLLSVPDEGYWAYLMKVIEETVVCTKLDIYVFILTMSSIKVLTASLSSLITLSVQWGLLWSKACEGGRDPLTSLSLSLPPLSLPPLPPLAPDLFVLAEAGTFSCLGGDAGLSLFAT